MKIRLIKELKKHTIILFIGFLYYLWVTVTNLYIPCFFRLITGFKCPGCGISYMLESALHLDFKASFLSNPFLFITLPVMLIIYFNNRIYYIKNGSKRENGKIIRFLEYLMLFLTVVYWIVRNI